MRPLTPVPAIPYVEQLSIGVGRRTLAISLALSITAILLVLLFSFGVEKTPGVKSERVSMVSLSLSDVSEDEPEPSPAERERAEKPPVAPEPTPNEPQPSQPNPLPPPPVVAPKAASAIVMPSEPAPVVPRIGVRPPGGAVYGPPNNGGSPSARDSQRVGTAPNGEPLYAASWYREPTSEQLRGYLSTASGPGWGLIACRTAPDYRVEDCVGLDEYPGGSQITRAVLAAAWEFRVRPPRVGGQSLVGSWVRIRIDYGVERR